MIRSAAPVAAALLAIGCGGGDGKLRDRLDERIGTGGADIAALASERRVAADTGIRIAARPWYGSEPPEPPPGTVVGEPLPAHVESGEGIAISVAAGTGIRDVADLVAKASGLPVAVELAMPGGDGEETVVQVRGGRPITLDGPLSLILDRIAGEYDMFWRYDGRTVRLLAADSRSWTLPVPTGSSSLSTTVGGVSAGEGRTISLTRSAETDAWAEVGSLVRTVLRPPATVSTLPGSARVTVTGRPSDIAAADRVLSEIAELHSIRIALEVAIYWIDAERTDSFDAGLASLVAASVPGGGDARSLSVAGDGSGGLAILAADGEDSLAFSFGALARDVSVVAHRSASTVTLSGVAAPIVLSTARNYVSEITRNEDGVSVETDTVDDGISLHMLPRLLSRERLQLSVTMLQNSFLRLNVFGNVQLPEVDQRMTTNEVLLAPGETLMISGFQQETASTSDRDGLLTTGEEANVDRLALVVMVRPMLLPI